MAAIHPLGSQKTSPAKRGGSGRPARPFFPVLGGKLTALAADKINEIARRKIESLLK